MRSIALLATTVLLLSACGDDDDATATTAATAGTESVATEPADTEPAATEAATATTEGSDTAEGGGDADLVIAGFAFPEEIRVAAGEPITISNEDPVEHTVTALDGTFNVTVGGNGTATIDPLEPGTYDFVCNFHGGMEGTLIVE